MAHLKKKSKDSLPIIATVIIGAWLSLPSEQAILEYVSKQSKSEAETVAYFVRLQNGKLGVREKVEDVLARARS